MLINFLSNEFNPTYTAFNIELWRAVGVAKNNNTQELPEVMYNNNIEIENEDLTEAFCKYFEEKIVD